MADDKSVEYLGGGIKMELVPGPQWDDLMMSLKTNSGDITVCIGDTDFLRGYSDFGKWVGKILAIDTGKNFHDFGTFSLEFDDGWYLIADGYEVFMGEKLGDFMEALKGL